MKRLSYSWFVLIQRSGTKARTMTVLLWAALATPTLAQQTWYVDQSVQGGPTDGLTWCTAFGRLQDATAVATPGDTVLVAEGEYRPHADDRSVSFNLTAGVTWQGGFEGCSADNDDAQGTGGNSDPKAIVTILTGDLASNDDPLAFPEGATFADNSYHVVRVVSGEGAARIEGFTIRGGYAESEILGDAGGGIVAESGDVIVTACLFEFNFAGRGAAIHKAGGWLEVVNSIFRRNSALRWGGAIDHYSSAGLIVNSVFIGNQTDGEGAAVHSDLATVTATNVTAVQNHAGNRGGGFFNYAGVELRGTNNICWMNRDQFGTGEESQVFNNASNLYVFDHSCITGWTGTGNGVGNHGLAPAFLLEPSPGPDETWNGIGDEFGDVRLSSSSSCRNTGNNNADINASEPDTQPLPAFDIAGKPRIAEGTVDMGAYEFGSEAVPAVGAWAMAVFMLALMAVAQLVFRRRGSLAD